MLREDVRARLNREIARRRLKHPEPIPVRWSPTGRPVQSLTGALAAWTLTSGGDVAGVPEFLRSLPRRQLVVLGAPGAGKSVLALLLAWDLLESWQPSEPVPVLLSLSSWRPSIGLRDWMAQHIEGLSPGLANRRRFGKDVATRLVDGGRVMPVLDGLDELPAALHASAIDAIDTAVAEGVQLLVTCRAAEYENTVRKTGRYLTRAAVVELESVQPAAAIAYLEHSKVEGDRRWGGVFGALRGEPDSVLAQALSSPLMLYLARTAYQESSTDPGELLDRRRFKTREEIESHLLDGYLPAVYAESSDPHCGAEQASRYLAVIARQMQRDGTFDFAWWQINSMVTGPLVGLAFGCGWGWFSNALFGPALGIVTGVVTGLLGYIAHARIRAKLEQVYVTEDSMHGPRVTLPRYARISVLSSLGAACVTGVAAAGWLIGVLEAEPMAAWRHGALTGVAVGVATLLGSAWGSYQVSRTWFSLTRRLPWGLMAFLDNAHGLGVLRQTGAVHQFRHARLQEQLSGKISPSARSAVETSSSAGRWKLLLPLLPSAAQVGLAMAGLMAVSVYYAGMNDVRLDFLSGDRPSIAGLATCNEPSCGMNPMVEMEWTLPRRASRHTTLTPGRTDGLSFIRWNGTVGAYGCATASVEVTLIVGDHSLAPFVVDNDDSSGILLKDKAPLPHAVRLEDQLVSVGLRRLDERPCDLVFRWVDPGLGWDGLEGSRKRFKIAASAAGS
ncbi:NACHT domain-containing protein [Streptomyces sp. NPDC059757]|uniref:NACHT domain-containing protein n=1 Tax=Streptomyces sp. NPDC059757 TaxID=3346935 RepID=UPI00364A39F6